VMGALTAPSAYFMKSPPIQYTDDEARKIVEEFITLDQNEKITPSAKKKVSKLVTE